MGIIKLSSNIKTTFKGPGYGILIGLKVLHGEIIKDQKEKKYEKGIVEIKKVTVIKEDVIIKNLKKEMEYEYNEDFECWIKKPEKKKINTNKIRFNIQTIIDRYLLKDRNMGSDYKTKLNFENITYHDRNINEILEYKTGDIEILKVCDRDGHYKYIGLFKITKNGEINDYGNINGFCDINRIKNKLKIEREEREILKIIYKNFKRQYIYCNKTEEEVIKLLKYQIKILRGEYDIKMPYICFDEHVIKRTFISNIYEVKIIRPIKDYIEPLVERWKNHYKIGINLYHKRIKESLLFYNKKLYNGKILIEFRFNEKIIYDHINEREIKSNKTKEIMEKVMYYIKNIPSSRHEISWILYNDYLKTIDIIKYNKIQIKALIGSKLPNDVIGHISQFIPEPDKILRIN